MQLASLRPVLVAIIAGLGCRAPSPATDSTAASKPPASAAVAQPSEWYRRVRTLDLTGDGKADSVRLEARGSRPDSLLVILTFVVDGVVRHREEWTSADELVAVDSARRAAPVVDAVVRARLDSVLARVVVQPLNAPSVRLMAEDSTILAGLVPRPTHRISVSYGYETTARLVWDAPRERFVRLWSCC